MKRYLLLLFIFIQSFAFSQNEKVSYHFDFMAMNNFKDYKQDKKGKQIYLYNSKDTTYFLSILYLDNSKYALITDYKKKHIIKFDVNFNYENIEDLNKLSNVRLYKEVFFEKSKKYKNSVETFEFEKDSTNQNNVIVHLTKFKNKKKKKIIEEHYYFYGKTDYPDIISKESLKNKLVEKYDIEIIKNLNLYKILHLDDGKLSIDTEVLETKIIDFNFQFTIDDVFPKYKTFNNTTTTFTN